MKTKVHPRFEKYLMYEDGGIYSIRAKRFLKPNITKDGYGRVCIHGIKYLSHRLTAETFILNPENKPQINHKDKNPLNNHIDNLEWCTNLENCRHSWENGRNMNKVAGENNTKCKISDDKVDEIRRILMYLNSLKYKMTLRGIAQYYGVSTAYLRLLEQGKIRKIKTIKNVK